MRKITILLALIFVFGFGYSQVTIWSENFTTGSYSVALGGEGNNGTADYFQKTDGSSPAINITYTGFTGNFFAGQDIDDGGWTSSASPSELSWSSISISGYSNISIEGLFASAATAKIDNADYLRISYKIDAGSWTEILWFENDGTGDDQRFLEDTDFDGNGDGAQLTSAAASFSKSIAGTGSTMDIRVTVSVDGDEEDIAFDELKLKGTSTASDIVTSSFTLPTNIVYTTYSASSSLTTGNSLQVAEFTIQDGGGAADADALATKLTALDIDIDNWTFIQAVAIFDGSTNVAEVSSISSGTVSFSSLVLDAADGGTKDFKVYVTFSTTVTDNTNIEYSISSATADASGSDFAAVNAGGSATDITGDNNKIEVTADRLEIEVLISPVTVATDFTIDVYAKDVNGNTDLDETSAAINSLHSARRA